MNSLPMPPNSFPPPSHLEPHNFVYLYNTNKYLTNNNNIRQIQKVEPK